MSAVYLLYNSFPVIRTASAKNRRFHVPLATFFVSPGDAPAIITQYVAWMERQFNACQTSRSSTYLTFFNLPRPTAATATATATTTATA